MRFLSGPLQTCFALLAIALPASAATITVDKAKGQTIQEGIDNAADGDTVLVGPGTYFENIDFEGKKVIVTSTLATDNASIVAATSATIIDGRSIGPVVTSSAEPDPVQLPDSFPGMTLSYFTIQHGGSPKPGLSPVHYGGVFLPHSGPQLIGNVITQNNYGGISVTGGAYIYVTSNTITANSCWGIVIIGGGVEATDNEISTTQTPATGCSISDVRGTIATNSSGILVDGGGIPDVYGSSFISGNNIESNVQVSTPGAPIEGGAAIAIYSGGAKILSNFIRFNSAPFARGGAIDIAAGSISFPAVPAKATVSILQNVIYQNLAGCGGAALAFNSGGLDTSFTDGDSISTYTLLVANNTIADNVIAPGAAAQCPADAQANTQIYATQKGLALPNELFLNNVISGDASTLITDCHQQDVPSLENQAVFDHNLLYSNNGAIFGSSCLDESAAPLNEFFGNIVANPQFFNSSLGDYRLSSSSPGIDAGNNGMVLTADLELGNDAFNNGPLGVLSTGTRGELAYVGDFTGQLRVQDATGKLDGTGQESDVIDIGAYELPGTRIQDNPLSLVISSVGLPTTLGPATLTAYVRAGETPAPVGGIQGAIVPSGTVTFFVDGIQTGDPAPIATIPSPILFFVDVIGVAYGLVDLNPGVHVLTATYQPAPTVDSTQSVAQVIGIGDTPASLSLAAYPYYTTIGSPVTFTVTEQPSSSGSFPSPISVLDLNSNAVLGTVIPDRTTGIGTLTTADLIPGYNIIQASFVASDLPSIVSNQVGVETVSSTALTLTSDLNPALAFTPFNLTATFSASTTTSVTGFVTFYAIRTQPGSFSQAIGRADIASGSATRSVSLAAGTYNLTAVYSGDVLHGGSTSPPVPETVLGLTTTITLTSALKVASAFQPVPLTAHVAGPATATAANITGTVTFSSNGHPIGSSKVGTDGNATLSPGFSPGSYTLTASYGGDDSFASSTSLPVTEIVDRGNTSTSVIPSPAPGYTLGAEAIEALVLPSAAISGPVPVPTGMVDFFDGGNRIAVSPVAATLSDSGQSNVSLSNLTAGTHNLTAVYSGDTNYLPSTSDAVALKIFVSDFTIAADSTLTIQTEHYKTLALNLASVGNFAETIAIACGNLPPFATCNFPGGGPKGAAALTAGATQTIAIIIDTDALLNFASTLHAAARPKPPLNIFALAFLLPLALFARRRRLRPHAEGGAPALFTVSLALLALATLSGCSSRYPGHTPPGTYNITVTGTGATTGRTHTANVILVVTK